MSEDSRVELMQRGFDLWEAGDVEGTLALYDPEIEVYAPPEIGNSGTFHGIAGFLEWSRNWFDAWESFEQDILSIEPLSERHVVSRVVQRGVGKGSGIEVERPATYLCEMRDGKLVYMALFFDDEAALEHARERERRAAT